MNYNLRYLIYFIGFLAIISAWYFFLYLSMVNSIAFYKAKISDLQKLKAKSVKVQQECPIIKNKINKIDKDINFNLDKFINPYNSINKIIKCILCNNLEIKECSPIKQIPIKLNSRGSNSGNVNYYSKSFFRLIIKGYFLDIYRFFDCLLKIDCFCELYKCSLKKEEQKIICELIFNFIVIL